MKHKEHKQYTKEFKQGAVRLVTEQGRKINDVAESLGVSPWCSLSASRGQGNYIYVPAGAPLNGGSAQTNGHQAFTLHTLLGSGGAENAGGGGPSHDDED